MTAIKFIFKYFKQIKLYTIATFGLFGLCRVFLYLDNYYIASLFGYIAENPTQIITGTSLTYIIIYAALHFGSNICDGLRTIFEVRMDIFLKRNIYKDAFKHTHKHSSLYFTEEMSGKVSDKIIQLVDSTMRCRGCFNMILDIVIIPYAVALPILFSVNKSLATTFLIFCIITCLFNCWHSKTLKPISRENAKLESEAVGIIVDSIANARLVKNCGAVLHEKAYLGKAFKKLVRSYLKQGHERGISNSFNTLSLKSSHPKPANRQKQA